MFILKGFVTKTESPWTLIETSKSTCDKCNIVTCTNNNGKKFLLGEMLIVLRKSKRFLEKYELLVITLPCTTDNSITKILTIIMHDQN